MLVEAIKNINITVLFSTPINHLLISMEGILNIFKEKNQKNQHTFIEAPGLKIATFPNLKKDLAFENVRFLINDKNEDINNTDIVSDLMNIMDSNMVEKEKIISYGFNYDIIITPKNEEFKIHDLVGEKIATLSNIKSAGVSISYEKDEITYVLEIKPINSKEQKQKFFAHFNAHFNNAHLPNEKLMKGNLIKQFEEFKKIVEKI